jgi:hypothetical protein
MNSYTYIWLQQSIFFCFRYCFPYENKKLVQRKGKFYKQIYDQTKELQTTVDRSITMYYFTLSQTKYPVIKPVTSVA